MKIKRKNNHIAPAMIDRLSRCEIFVFGSNILGHHTGGAAAVAHKRFGAQWGVGSGPTGRCYAIPTTQGDIDAIRPYVDRFTEYAARHPQNRFLLTRIGCGHAGFSDKQIAPLFYEAAKLPNVAIPREWIRFMGIDCFLGVPPRGRDEAPRVVDGSILFRLCEKYRYEIGAGIAEHIPDIRVRYVRGTNDFGYTRLENLFFAPNGDMYVWEDDDRFAPLHNQDVVDAVFRDECFGRGYACHVLFAGVSTGFRDAVGDLIYTGDVIRIIGDAPIRSTGLAVAAFHDCYCFMLDNHFLPLRKCGAKNLIRVGTVFFQLDPYKRQGLLDRALSFNSPYDTPEKHDKKLIMARYTPEFEQELWHYEALYTLGAEYNWRK